MKDLRIEEAKNGFIVYEQENQSMVSDTWVFESPKNLAEFIKEWAEETEAKRIKQ